MRAVEAAWFQAGNDSFALMRRAGDTLAETAAAMAPDGPIHLLLGQGNNGGDGWIAAAALLAAGREVVVSALGPPATPDARRAAEGWTGAVLGPDAPLPRAALRVDALFGLGLSRALSGDAARMVRAANADGTPILAADIASGVDADTGRVAGPAVRASATLAFHAPKPGHLLLPGLERRGRLLVADLGLPEAPGPQPMRRNGLGAWAWPRPDAQSHKYRRGAVLIWSGPKLSTGASRLSAMAALRAGAGAVTLAGPPDALLVHACRLDAVMLAEAGDAAGFAARAASPKVAALLVGPGAGPQARAVAEAALASGKPVVLDADALTAFAGDAPGLARRIGRHQRPVLLTPHAGEWARLFPDGPDHRPDAVRAGAALMGATILLKGADTLIAGPDGRLLFHDHGPPWLATAGSGDVLAGFATALLAQGLPAAEAAGAAAFLHAEAARRAGPGLVAEDLAGRAAARAIAAILRAEDRQAAEGSSAGRA